MNSYPSSGSSIPSQLTGSFNFPSNQVNMSLAPQNGPFQPPHANPAVQGYFQPTQAYQGPVSMPTVQGSLQSEAHYHRYLHYYHQIGMEQMRRYSHAIHDQAHAYSLWYQQMNAMHGFSIPQPYQFQPLPLPAPPMNPLYHQASQSSATGRLFNKDQVRILKKQFAKDNKIDREEIEKLAPIVGLTPAQIRHWFSNERAKVRKYGEKKKEEQEKEKVEVVVKKEIIVVKIECDSE
ncbi:hypothetical protein B9Z55_012650 [Caenorhabditis nigoni]|uniref:Homeobox domain-containing protein n=1 Tax=Caenorhabditis nigoni TaxID=1611254 RepID=A0A2G5TY55_9PELO|nr:hypothetical protein B9Z55_012650 [Caenorhabditis nigoni]